VFGSQLFKATFGEQIFAFFRVAAGIGNQAAQAGVAIVVARQQYQLETVVQSQFGADD